MPIQPSEDAGRNLRSIWLGPTNGWRWWFDATFEEWAVGICFWIAAALTLTFVLPLGALLVIVALAGGRWVATSQADETWAWLLRAKPDKGRQRARRAFTGLLVAFGLLWFPRPLTWLLPMHWWLAGPAAIYCACRFVKRVRPWIDANRPVGYWISALKDITRGPRPHREPLEITPALGEEYDEIDRTTMDFEASVMAFDLERMVVITYRENTEYEAVLFDSTIADERACAGVVAWLRAAGADVVTKDAKYVEYENAYVLRKVTVIVNGQPLKDGNVVVLNRASGTFRQFNRHTFARNFSATETIEETTNARA